MSDRHPHAQLIRLFHDRQNRFYAGGKQGPVGAMLTDDVTWHVPGYSTIAGDYRGRDEVLRYFARRRELADATFRIDVRGVLADDERAVILAGGEVESGGETLAWRTLSIFRFAGGRIAECWVLPYDQHRFDEIWSSDVGQSSRHTTRSPGMVPAGTDVTVSRNPVDSGPFTESSGTRPRATLGPAAWPARRGSPPSPCRPPSSLPDG
jgi:uncharacterized protein